MTGQAGGTGAPLAAPPLIETRVGALYVYNPTFSYRAFVTQAIDVRLGSWRLMPSSAFALDAVNARLGVLAAYRIHGPTPRSPAPDRRRAFLDTLDLEGAITHHRYGDEHFEVTTPEVSLQGRMDLGVITPSLRGSFMELGGGVGIEIHHYPSLDIDLETSTLLLARFAYGITLGRPPAPWGEAMLYYDHRRDGFAAGLKMPGVSAGFAGHFGARGTLQLIPTWALCLDAEAGSALTTGLSLVYRHGASR